uniref:Major facilitator superfamily (MFS) profile domain-containing protein n=1 Tax=Megaselia scalaris TaxID=36166 RepID=T1GWJ9_MEGSC
MMTAGQTIFTEITAGNYRIGLVTLYDTFWSVGLFFLPTLSSFFTSWGQIYLGISFPTIILIVSLIWIPEAPRWLLKNKNDIKEVEAIILRAAEINDRKYLLPSNLRDELHLQATSLKSQPPQAKWLDLWKGPRAKTHFIASHMALAFYIINFMGMLLNTRSFGRDYLAVNTIFTGFSEVIGCFMAMYFSIHLKEKKWQYS